LPSSSLLLPQTVYAVTDHVIVDVDECP